MKTFAQIITAAHANARTIKVAKGCTYRVALSEGMKQAWAAAKAPVVEAVDAAVLTAAIRWGLSLRRNDQAGVRSFLKDCVGACAGLASEIAATILSSGRMSDAQAFRINEAFTATPAQIKVIRNA